MQPTLLGIVIALIEAYLLFRGSVTAMFWVMLSCTLMGGAAVLSLPALGGSSVPPVQFASMCLVARILLPGSGRTDDVKTVVRANLLLGLYALYGVVTAMISPRIFAGHINIVPMRYEKLTTMLQTFPLGFTSQNITASVYLMGTFLAACVAFIAVRQKDAPHAFVKVTTYLAWAHVLFGLLGAAFGGGIVGEALKFFRNANYAQLDQSFNGFSRLNGIFPEASAYAAYAFGWFVFQTECWYRDVLPRRTGPAAAALGAVLVLSTSSTAYVSLVIYGAIFFLRALFLPWSVPSRKLILMCGVAVLLTCLVGAVVFALPAKAVAFEEMFTRATLGKQGSMSGMQRAFWARTGWHAFVQSHGIGIGPGSFRSSSFIMAMLGSVGVIGSLLFAGYFIRVWRPLRASTYLPTRDFGTALGAAASWAALAVLIPATLIAPGPDPGTDFAIFAGVALALRTRPERRTKARHDAGTGRMQDYAVA